MGINQYRQVNNNMDIFRFLGGEKILSPLPFNPGEGGSCPLCPLGIDTYVR